MPFDTAKLYRAFRSRFPKVSASDALHVAREAAKNGPTKERARFDLPSATDTQRGQLFRGESGKVCVYWRASEYPRETCVYNPRAGFGAAEAWKPATGGHVRWIENTGRAGLRDAGFADEISKAEGSRSIDHTGWYTDPFGDSDGLMRGIVFRLPARGGRSVFVYGYADPHNTGAALLCFDNDADNLLEAARYADSFAERMAESERDYQTKDMAKNKADELREHVKELRGELRAIRSELSACRKRCKNWRKSKRYTALLGAVRHRIAELREEIETETGRASQLEAEPYTILDSRF